jgi:hypothetical protein
MKTITFTIPLRDLTTATVTGYTVESAPGLALHRNLTPGMGKFWNITHIGSGSLVARGIMGKTIGQGILILLGDVADWRMDPAELAKVPGISGLVARAFYQVHAAHGWHQSNMGSWRHGQAVPV